MKPLSNHIHVERVIRPTYNHDGVIQLPPVLLDDNNTRGPKEYRVLAVGPGKVNKKGILIPIECEPGDRLIVQSYTVGEELLADGTALITDDMIIAVIPKHENRTHQAI